jgi:hypothetical protein
MKVILLQIMFIYFFSFFFGAIEKKTLLNDYAHNIRADIPQAKAVAKRHACGNNIEDIQECSLIITYTILLLAVGDHS